MGNKMRLTDLLRKKIDKYLNGNYFLPKNWHHGDYVAVNDNLAKGQLVYKGNGEAINYTIWSIKDDDGWYDLTDGFNCHYHSSPTVTPKAIALTDFFRALHKSGVSLDMFLFNENDHIRSCAATVINEKE